MTMSLSNSGGIFPKGNTNGEEKNYSSPNNRTWCCPAGTIPTDAVLVVSPLPLPPLLLLPLWWWAQCLYCCFCSGGGGVPAAPAVACMVVGLSPLLASSWS